MHRAYLSLSAADVFRASDSELYGQLALNLPFAVDPPQRAAWEFQISHLRQLASTCQTRISFWSFSFPEWAVEPTSLSSTGALCSSSSTRSARSISIDRGWIRFMATVLI